jgi:hypothetical protein
MDTLVEVDLRKDGWMIDGMRIKGVNMEMTNDRLVRRKKFVLTPLSG